MKIKVKTILVILLLSSFSTKAFAVGVKISGYVFGDYYAVALNNNPLLDNMHGFWFRRIYLTSDFNILEELDARLRVELSSSGDFMTSIKLTPTLKDAYLKWKAMKTLAFILGLSPTPTWNVVEKHWGFRSVEKTPLDLAKFGSSRDLGLSIKGSFLEKIIRYHLMFANGSGTSAEINSEKKFYVSISLVPIDFILFEVYGDYELGAGHTDKYTLQGFLGLENSLGRIGVFFAHQHRQGTPDLNLEILSVYVVANILNNLRSYVRVDRNFDPNPSGKKIAYIQFNDTARSTFLLIGFDYEPWKNVHFQPNIETIFYDALAGGPTPSTDLIARLTFFFKFSG